jgi:hypothetical protein
MYGNQDVGCVWYSEMVIRCFPSCGRRWVTFRRLDYEKKGLNPLHVVGNISQITR